ncbi:MAG: type III-B CRISPR module-associated protein Cmr5 [Lewinellaceae bacterium]|nr:type III-B CRISPR module-associated protein Cmr5 [Lewinellaceae bacterium]
MSNGTSRTKLEQGRAAFAFQCAVEGEKLGKNKEYKSYVKKMPMLIKTNGLGAAIAFVFAKGSKGGEPNRENPWGLLYAQIEEWILKDEKKLIAFAPGRLAQALTETESWNYRSVTIEVLAFLNWLKRFADALIEGESQE